MEIFLNPLNVIEDAKSMFYYFLKIQVFLKCFNKSCVPF